MTTKLLRPSGIFQTPRSLRNPAPTAQLPQTRHFLKPPLQTIRASRTLPYPTLPIYNIIASVPRYSSFLPYCLSSTVTRWSRPDATYRKRWPEEAELEIGWGAVMEKFTSRVYCVPGRVVEAVGGSTETQLPRDEIEHHEIRNGSKGEDGIMTHLLTRWTVEPVQKIQEGTSLTNVSLDLEFQFANPVYAAMSSAVQDRVAEIMIEAFEKKVKSELEGGQTEEVWPQDLVNI